MQPQTCLNCNARLDAAQNFCPRCGQKTTLHRLSLHEIGHDLVHYFTHADKGIFQLLKQLATRPGHVQREYVAGKIKSYFPPLNFFLIVATVFVFISSLLNSSAPEQVIPRQQQAAVAAMAEGPKKQQAIARNHRTARAMTFITKYSNVLAMVATPIITLIYFLFYFKGRYNFTEHLVANMYISGFTVLSHALIFMPLMKLLNLTGLNAVLLAYFLYEIAYRSISYYRFMNKTTRAAAAKVVAVSTFCLLFWGMLTMAVITFYIMKGF